MTKTGQCHCGAVKFSVEGEPVFMAQCHCNACKRLSGTGHMVQAFFGADQLTVTGETTMYESPGDSGATKLRQFCPKCGSTLFGGNSRNAGRLGIPVGAFDNSDWFKPQKIVYFDDKPVWDVVDPEIETVAKM